MNEFREKFKSLDAAVVKEYEKLDIKCILEIEMDGMPPSNFMSESIKGVIPLNKYNWYELETDIEFCSNDLKYYTALLFLLRPYINFPLSEGSNYFQTLEDKRYLSYASILFQLLYNYWDRLGDFLFCFLETNLNERDVYINRVIQNLGNNYSSSKFYFALSQIYDKHLAELFNSRKTIVHYLQIGARMFTGTFRNYGDDEKLRKLEEEKRNYPEYFKRHIELTFEGFENAIRLVNECGLRK